MHAAHAFGQLTFKLASVPRMLGPKINRMERRKPRK